MHFLIDGYNLIWSTDRFFSKSSVREGTLQQQRESLLRFLENARMGTVTVVFDGQEDMDSPRWRGEVGVIFSRGEEADEVIKRKVTQASNPAVLVVVTDDREVDRWARLSKAKVLSCKEFLREADKKSKRRPGTPSGSLGREEAVAINDELKRLWKLE